jgi:hypothetical protein
MDKSYAVAKIVANVTNKSLSICYERPRPFKTPQRAKRAPRDLVPLDKTTGAARFFDRMVREIENDLGGRRQLSRMESQLIRAFGGASTTLEYLNQQILLGEGSEIDLGGYATLASTMLRIASRLGLARRPKDLTPPSLQTFLAQRARSQEAEAANDSDDR